MSHDKPRRQSPIVEGVIADPVVAITPGTRCSGVATGETSLGPGRLTISAARTDLMLVIPRIVRPIPPWEWLEDLALPG
jgi:hypothetical protein